MPLQVQEVSTIVSEIQALSRCTLQHCYGPGNEQWDKTLDRRNSRLEELEF